MTFGVGTAVRHAQPHCCSTAVTYSQQTAVVRDGWPRQCNSRNYRVSIGAVAAVERQIKAVISTLKVSEIKFIDY